MPSHIGFLQTERQQPANLPGLNSNDRSFCSRAATTLRNGPQPFRPPNKPALGGVWVYNRGPRLYHIDKKLVTGCKRLQPVAEIISLDE